MVLIAEILVADEPDAWRGAGFAVGEDGVCRIGTVVVRVVPGAGGAGTGLGGASAVRAAGPSRGAGDGGGGPGSGASSLSSLGTGSRGRRGVVGWTLAGSTLAGGPGALAGGTIDGLPTAVGEVADPPDGPPVAHPNGCTSIDHVVAMTPDLDRTTAALAAAGLEARRTREAGTGPDGVPRLQRFFRLGEVILELVGPARSAGGPGAGTGAAGDRPARFWGLAHTVADLDATAALLGDRLSPPRDAVQPGRRIASLRREAGVAVPTAFLTPDGRHSPS